MRLRVDECTKDNAILGSVHHRFDAHNFDAEGLLLVFSDATDVDKLVCLSTRFASFRRCTYAIIAATEGGISEFV